MTNIKPDNGMDPAVEGLEVVGYIPGRSFPDIQGQETTWVAMWNKPTPLDPKPVVLLATAQAAVQAAYQRGVLGSINKAEIYYNSAALQNKCTIKEYILKW